jgi:hypothetical protein
MSRANIKILQQQLHWHHHQDSPVHEWGTPIFFMADRVSICSGSNLQQNPTATKRRRILE